MILCVRRRQLRFGWLRPCSLSHVLADEAAGAVVEALHEGRVRTDVEVAALQEGCGDLVAELPSRGGHRHAVVEEVAPGRRSQSTCRSLPCEVR